MCITWFLLALSVLAKMILVMVQTAAGTMCHCARSGSTALDVPKLQPCLEESLFQAL